MLVTNEREKLINAIIFFAQHTKHCGKIKLFKMLYFLDFEHFKQTGRSVTGLDYYAWKMGPVPVRLFEEIESPEPDMASALDISQVPTRYGKPMLTFTPTVEFSNENFSKRESKILKDLAAEFEDTKAEDMIEATHLENQPWDRVFNQQNHRQAQIPYEYAIRTQERDRVMAVAREHKEVVELLK